MRSTPTGSSGSSRGPCWPAGGCSAAIPGAVEASTTRATRGSSRDRLLDPHRPLLHTAHVREASAEWRSLLAALSPERRGARELPLVRLGADRHLRREPARVDLLHVRDDAAVPAGADDDPAVCVHPVHHQLPSGARSLLDDDEPLDRRPGAHHPAPDPEGHSAYRSEALLADSAQGSARRRRPAGGRGGTGETERAAAQGEAEEEGTALMELQVEASGETVGEAKWSALRELEKQQPGLDKSAVRFQVVSEGERGLLGVGYAPARVIASISAEPPVVLTRGTESELAEEVRELIERIADAIGGAGRIDLEEDDDRITASCAGPDLGMLIGRHGQTIDAIQYLANAVMFRRHGEDRQEVVVDAT